MGDYSDKLVKLKEGSSSEDQYLLVQDLTRVRIACDVLREVISVDVKDIMKQLYKHSDELFERTETK